MKKQKDTEIITKTVSIIVATTALILVAASCANQPQKVSQNPNQVDQHEPRVAFTEEQESKAISNQAAMEADANYFLEIKFNEGSSQLDKNSKASIRALVEKVSQSGKIDDIKILSWADNEYPSEKQKRLPESQRNLASKRNVAVEKFIKSLRRVDVDKYNMAEQPGVVSRLFNTTDTRLKKTMVAAGLPTTADNPQYPSKASHSVILVKLE